MKQLLAFGVVLGLFVGSSLTAVKYHDAIASVVADGNILAMIIFLGVEIAGVIVAPFNTVIFTPFAVAAWGPAITAILSLTGWTIGSLLAFLLARRYGQPLVEKLPGLRKIEEMAQVLPENNLFWSVVLLRILVPADLVSYALGLFTPMKPDLFALASLLGHIPSALAYSYGATIHPALQVILGLITFALIGWGYRHYSQLSDKRQNTA